MKLPRRILVPQDFSDASSRAADYAAVLARRLGASLVLVHAIDAGLLPIDVERLKGQAVAGLRALGARLDVAETESLVVVAPEVEAIRAASDEGKADLIVMATQGRGPVARAFLGSVATSIVRASPVPVLLVPANSACDLSRAPSRVIVGTDLREGSQPAIDVAIDLADRFGANVTLLHVYDLPPLPPEAVRFLDDVDFAGNYERDCWSRLHAIAPKREGVAVELDVVRDKPALGLLSAAKRSGADLIVLGRRAHTRVDRALHGSVVDNVVRSARCPVLAVPTP